MTKATDFVRGLTTEALDHEAANHVYLRCLEAGALRDVPGALRALVHHYAHYSEGFTHYLEGTMAQIDDPAHVALLRANLEEERGRVPEGLDPALSAAASRPHAALFADFQRAIGVDADYAEASPICPVTRAWREAFTTLCTESGASVAVGAIGIATELIVPTIYQRILRALRAHTHLGEREVVFFTLHASCDEAHSADLLQVAASLATDDAGRRGLRRGMEEALAWRCRFWDARLREADVRPSVWPPAGEASTAAGGVMS